MLFMVSGTVWFFKRTDSGWFLVLHYLNEWVMNLWCGHYDDVKVGKFVSRGKFLA